ncbi:MAG: Xaa-Pro peptidase family protein [Planctomycetota bacterium]
MTELTSMIGDIAPPSSGELAERREKLRAEMTRAGVDALFLEPGASLRYVTGVDWHPSERPFGMVLTRDGATILCPAFEERRAGELLEDLTSLEILPWQEHEDAFEKLAHWWSGQRLSRLAVDPATRLFMLEGIRRAIDTGEVINAAPLIQACRGRKSPLEIERMRLANRITQRAIAHGQSQLRVGMTQTELSQIIQEAHVALGAPPGWTLVLFGECSAYPHGRDDGHGLREGEVVLTDCGTNVFGYQSDVTRTTVFGEPTKRQLEIWNVVDRAQRAAFEAARPGNLCQDVDRAARQVIDEAGFGPGYRTFSHRLGHGIGLEGHEWPYLVEGSEVVIEPGMTFSNEPGIYIPGELGIRLETIIHITEEGCEYLGVRQDAIQ